MLHFSLSCILQSLLEMMLFQWQRHNIFIQALFSLQRHGLRIFRFVLTFNSNNPIAIPAASSAVFNASTSFVKVPCHIKTLLKSLLCNRTSQRNFILKKKSLSDSFAILLVSMINKGPANLLNLRSHERATE